MKRSKNNFTRVMIFLCGIFPASLAWSHGGVSVDIDSCRIPVDDQWVHFTGYTPMLTADAEYCKAIPDIGLTNIVFDYEGKKLRNMTVEFEITKEPEGTRVYYQEPATHPTGSINATIPFDKFGAGDYLAHVSLVNKGKKIDAHLPFSVGAGDGSFPLTTLFGILIAIVGVMSVAYLSNNAFKEKVDVALGKG